MNKNKKNKCLRQYVPSVYVSILLSQFYYANKISIFYVDQTYQIRISRKCNK